MSVLEKVRRWIDGESAELVLENAARDAQVKPRSQAEEFIVKIALPHAMPDIFAGLRLALTVSLILAVVTEMLSGVSGLGHNIIIAARSFRSADLYAGIIVLGVIGYATNVTLERVERHMLRWRGTRS